MCYHTYAVNDGVTAIQVWSELNEWMDYTFWVRTPRVDDAVKVLSAAWDDWFDTDPNDTMLDHLFNALARHGIGYRIR